MTFEYGADRPKDREDRNPRSGPDKRLSIVAIAPVDLARALSAASGRTITEDQVRTIAEDGRLLAADDTINLLKYTAYLAQQEAQNE